MNKKKILNSGLKCSIEKREIITKEKIQKAINSLIIKNKEFSVQSISKEANLSRLTIYKFSSFIESLIPLKITKSIDVKELKDIISKQNELIKKNKDKYEKLKQENEKLIEQLFAIKLYIDEKKLS